MRLRRLTGLERHKIEDELTELREKIAWYQKVLGDITLVLNIIKEELLELRGKHADKRRTEISSAAKDLDVEDLIAEEDMVVTITKAGYVKRLPVATYRQQKRGGKGLQGVNLKDQDFVEHLFIASTHDYMLIFSTRGKVYRMKVHELPLGSRHAKGAAVVNLLPFEQTEKIAAVINTKTFSPDEFLMFATKHGMVKKTAIQAYDRSRRDGIIAINLRDDDELISVRRVRDGEKVMMVSTAGKAIKWDESEARPMGRDTMGVKGMNIKPGEACLGMEIAPDGQRAVRGDRARLRQANPGGRVPGAPSRRTGRQDDPGHAEEGPARRHEDRRRGARAHAHLRGGRRHPREGRRHLQARTLDAGREGDERLRDRSGERDRPGGRPARRRSSRAVSPRGRPSCSKVRPPARTAR